MERQLINYLPFILLEIPAIRTAMDVQQPEFALLWDEAQDFQDDLFVLSAGNRGLTRWEKMLELLPKTSDTLDTRRSRILAVQNRQLPYTLPQLRSVLDSLYGPGTTTADVAENSYLLQVTVPITDSYLETIELVDSMSPQNLLTQYSISLGNERLPLHLAATTTGLSMSYSVNVGRVEPTARGTVYAACPRGAMCLRAETRLPKI